MAVQGVIDYRLAKRAVLEKFRRGALNRLDVCDAHPELMRAAKNIGEMADSPCPVCRSDSLRHVRYVYGDQLKHLSGRPVYPPGWEVSLSREHTEFRCYTIEVCTECSWNHLAACHLMGSRYKADQAPSAGQRRRRSSLK